MQGFLPLFWGFDIGIPRLLGGQDSAKGGEYSHLTVTAFVGVVIAYADDDFICFFGFCPDCKRGQPRSVGALPPFNNTICVYFNAIIDEFVLSYNERTNQTEYKKVLNSIMTSPEREVIVIEYKGRELTLTPDHRVLTKRGYIEAQDLLESDELIVI